MADSILVKLNVIYFVILFLFYNSYTSSATLKAVFMIHRHGDRTPISAYPKDPYINESHWPDGWGQLTANGKRRMYKLGQYIRKRYKNFLTSNPREAYIRSSAVPRCLESAQLVAAGIYPPEGRWVWSSSANWLPFPVLTEPRVSDGMLNPGSLCPAAQNELNRKRASPEVVKAQEKYRDLFNYLSLNTGQKVTDIFTAESIYDTLKIQKENYMKLPDWVNDKTMQQLNRIAAQTFYIDYSNKILQRFRAGLLLKELRKRFKDLTDPPRKSDESEHPNYPELLTSGRKLFIYSTHDSLVSALLNALGAFNMLAPPYGASIIFELQSSESTDGEHIIKSFYLNKTQSENPHPLKLSGCADGNSCKLGEFLHATEELIPDSWRRECGFSADESTLGASGLIYFIIAGATIITFTMITMFIIYMQRRKKPFVYKLLPVVN